MSLNDLARKIHGINVDKGFWPEHENMEAGHEFEGASLPEPERNFGELLMLVVSECAEALEAWRDGLHVTEMTYGYKIPENRDWDYSVGVEGYLVQTRTGEPETLTPQQFRNFLTIQGCPAKPEGVPSELADILIRVLDICGAYSIDIEAAVQEKIRYNETRARLHGRSR